MSEKKEIITGKTKFVLTGDSSPIIEGDIVEAEMPPSGMQPKGSFTIGRVKEELRNSYYLSNGFNAAKDGCKKGKLIATTKIGSKKELFICDVSPMAAWVEDGEEIEIMGFYTNTPIPKFVPIKFLSDYNGGEIICKVKCSQCNTPH